MLFFLFNFFHHDLIQLFFTLILILFFRNHFREQPIFSCNAHVFHIDPKTKRTWITASTKAVSVSFFYDSSRNLYRIISVEGSKAVINSTITPNMTFTQTSQKFGQWSDVRANTVYGLGFSSEAELAKVLNVLINTIRQFLIFYDPFFCFFSLLRNSKKLKRRQKMPSPKQLQMVRLMVKIHRNRLL